MKIVLATDGSECADEAAWLLAHLPHRDKLEITVLFISNLPNLRGVPDAGELLKRLKLADLDRSKSILSNLASLFDGANATLKLVVGERHVGTQIVELAQAQKSDLIVLGAIGHSLFERLFGSTSEFVSTHAKCSVLVVRPTGLRTAKRPIEVCVACDDTESSVAIMEQLAHFGWGANSKMDVVHVVSVPLTYSEVPIPFDLDEMLESSRRALTCTENQLRELTPEVESHVWESSHVGDGLVQFVAKNHSDVFVLGSTGGGGFSTFLLGSVSKYVLRHAGCSVWIARRNEPA